MTWLERIDAAQRIEILEYGRMLTAATRLDELEWAPRGDEIDERITGYFRAYYAWIDAVEALEEVKAACKADELEQARRGAADRRRRRSRVRLWESA